MSELWGLFLNLGMVGCDEMYSDVSSGQGGNPVERIAHISIVFSRGRMLGVRRKLAEMAEAAQCEKIPIDFYLINREHSGKDGALNLVCVDEVLGPLTGLKLRGMKYHFLSRLVPLEQYSALVLRYHYADPSMLVFMRANRGRVFFEHHTRELDEIWKSGMRFPLRVAQYVLEKTIAPRGLRGAAGIVAVTSQFLEHQRERAGLPCTVPTLVMPNGAVFQGAESELLEVGTELELAFVADRFRPWHGLERLLRSLTQYTGELPICLHLVGGVSETQAALVAQAQSENVRVVVHGEIPHDQLASVLCRVHIGIDSLAGYALGMKEASTLKVKLYVDHGLPWLGSMPDADVGINPSLCYLAFNSDENIDFESVILWRCGLDAAHTTASMKRTQLKMGWQRKLSGLCEWVFQAQR